MSEKLITLAFEPQRLDYIAQVLAQRPYSEVAPVLADIQQQLAEQQPLPPPPPTIARDGAKGNGAHAPGGA